MSMDRSKIQNSLCTKKLTIPRINLDAFLSGNYKPFNNKMFHVHDYAYL